LKKRFGGRKQKVGRCANMGPGTSDGTSTKAGKKDVNLEKEKNKGGGVNVGRLRWTGTGRKGKQPVVGLCDQVGSEFRPASATNKTGKE